MISWAKIELAITSNNGGSKVMTVQKSTEAARLEKADEAIKAVVSEEVEAAIKLLRLDSQHNEVLGEITNEGTGVDTNVNRKRRAKKVPKLKDMTVDDLKTLISEVVAVELQKWSNQSTITIETESKDLDNFANKKPYINAEGRYVLPKVTPEEQVQRNQSLIALLDKWVEEGDAEEQRETYECLQQISRVSI